MSQIELTSYFCCRLLEVCFEYGKTVYGRKLADMAREKFGKNVIQLEYFMGFLRNYTKSIRTKEEVNAHCVT